MSDYSRFDRTTEELKRCLNWDLAHELKAEYLKHTDGKMTSCEYAQNCKAVVERHNARIASIMEQARQIVSCHGSLDEEDWHFLLKHNR